MASNQTVAMLEHARRMAAKYPDNPEWQKQVTALEFIVNNQAHTATGQRTPPPPLPDDFSPVEVQNAEGYEQLDLMPVELPTSQTTLNKYFSGPVHQGLNVSKKRYYGCHLLQKRQESARLWIEQPDAVAEHYGVSKRIIAMAGHAMLDQWVMLPTMNMHNMDGSEQPPYVMGPFWPYNQTEQEVWKAMFVKYHFVGVSVMAGQLHGGVVVYNGVSIPRTYVHTITNHPQWIAYAMNAYFETAQYKSRAFSVALNLAHQIDVGSAQPVKGYEKRLPGQWGDEPTATKDIPAFVAGAEF